MPSPTAVDNLRAGPDNEHHDCDLRSSSRINLEVTNDGYRVSVVFGPKGTQTAVKAVIDTLEARASVCCEYLGVECPSSCPVTSCRSDGTCIESASYEMVIGDIVVPSFSVHMIYGYSRMPASTASVEGSDSGQSDTLDASAINSIGLLLIDREHGTSKLFDKISEYSLSLNVTDPFLVLNGIDDSYIDSLGLSKFQLLTVGTASWFLEPTALQWDSTIPIQPCSSDTANPCTAGIDTRHEGVQMSSHLFSHFSSTYLNSARCLRTGQGSMEYDSSVKLPRLTLSFGDKEFYIEPEDYTKPSASRGRVQALVGDCGVEIGWLLGTLFLRKHYVYFDSIAGTVTLYCREDQTCGPSSLPSLSTPLRP